MEPTRDKTESRVRPGRCAYEDRYKTASSASGDTVRSDESDKRLSVSSNNSTAPSLGGQNNNIPPSSNSLRCPFYLVCYVEFSPSQTELWISHSISHFGSHNPPTESFCTFCDISTSWGEGDPRSAWIAKMRHVRTHLAQELNEATRPDFLAIEHLWQKKLITQGNYDHAITYSEVPYCAELYLVPPNFEIQDARKEREEMTYFDQAQEDRQRRRR